MINEKDTLDMIERDLKTTRGLKLILMKLLSKKNISDTTERLTRTCLEKERKYERTLIDKRRKTQETIQSLRDLGESGVTRSYEEKVQVSGMV